MAAQAKSVQQLILTMLPYHPLYFPRIKSLKKRKKLLSINFYHYFKKRIHISLIFFEDGKKICSEIQPPLANIHTNPLGLLQTMYFVKYLQAGAIAGVFYNIKNGLSFITSTSSSNDCSNCRELAFKFTFCLEVSVFITEII